MCLKQRSGVACGKTVSNALHNAVSPSVPQAFNFEIPGLNLKSVWKKAEYASSVLEKCIRTEPSKNSLNG